MTERETQIRDIRHAEKPEDIKPDDITQEDVRNYTNTHNLGPHINDAIIKQIIIINRGGPVFRQEDWNSELDPNDKTTITYEGIRASHDFANGLFEEADKSKKRSVYLFIPSPAGRTMETQAVIQDRIEQLSKRDESRESSVVRLENLQDMSSAVMPDKKSIFLFQTQGVADLGPINNPVLGGNKNGI